jgi:hypothetical protein
LLSATQALEVIQTNKSLELMPARQAKNWCFTLNNYTEDEKNSLIALGSELQFDLRYLIFGEEKGDKEETPHLQGYISFEKRKSFGVVKTLVSGRAHLEPAKGSPSQNKDYCSKGDNIQQFGQLPAGKGSRSDLHEIANTIKAGTTFKQIAEEYPSAAIRYGTGILRLQQLYRPQREGPPEIWCLWGKTGTGKTRRVWEFADVDKLWVHPGDRWFDGYDNQPAVLFDDFDGGWFKLTYLLKLIDRYIFQVPVKGSYVWWAPKTIYFTSNHHPKEWYPQAKQEHVNALLRRFKDFGKIQHCT